MLVACLAVSAVVPWLPRGTTAVAQSAPAHTITWDSHSLFVDGRRQLLYSGEFDYWRLPSQGQWLDRLQKMKAAGLNAVSIYFDWQYQSNAPGQYNFSGVRDIDALLRMTDRLGLYVLARVGPYVNAELDAGGLPGWLLTKPVYLRSQQWTPSGAKAHYSPEFTQAAAQWYAHLLPILARHQVTVGGSVILVCVENEYFQNRGSARYMQDLVDLARSDGITVPIYHNDSRFKGDWSSLTNLYAYDLYPYAFHCCGAWGEQQFRLIDTWEQTLRAQLKINTPMFVGELQGGSYDFWGGTGYAAIARTLGADWRTAVDQSALAQGATILNVYMFTGGTSWGYMSMPGVYTSYDYGAPISETGELRPAYYAAHRLAMFLRSSGAALAGADAAPAVAVPTNPHVAAHVRVDESSGQIFAFLRHADPGKPLLTKLRLRLGSRIITVPQAPGNEISVAGHGAQLLSANLSVGPVHLDYSTSQILTDAATSTGHYLVLYGNAGTSGETDIAAPTGRYSLVSAPGVRVTRAAGSIRLDYRHTGATQMVTIQTASGAVHLLIVDTYHASRFWQVGSSLISGADLVTDDGTIRIMARKSEHVSVYGQSSLGMARVDGHAVGGSSSSASLSLGTVQGPAPVRLPALGPWMFHAASPELAPGFDDSKWLVADHSSTTNPNVPATSTLLADDYGFHYGFVWYRGHFTATGKESAVLLAARHSYDIYLNGVRLGGADETLDTPPHVHGYAATRSFAIPKGVVKPGRDNVISVLTESLGHDEGWLAGPLAQSPQGILSASLAGSTAPILWRIQGHAGGEEATDPYGGALNASGLYGERQGWYLPGLNDHSWRIVSVPDDWKRRHVGAAVGWYRTHFRLNLPADAKIPIGVTLPHVADKAVIWVNGWLIGRYWEQRGPQHTFYLPDGPLHRQGNNVLAIAVWNRGHDGGLTAPPTLTAFPALQVHSLTVAKAASEVQTPSKQNAYRWIGVSTHQLRR